MLTLHLLYYDMLGRLNEHCPNYLTLNQTFETVTLLEIQVGRLFDTISITTLTSVT